MKEKASFYEHSQDKDDHNDWRLKELCLRENTEFIGGNEINLIRGSLLF